MQKMIDHIVEIEWTMFHNTKNIGGPASCQNDRSQFEIMRKAQFLAWNEELLRSYEQDLLLAVANGQNLVTYKYAYMMETTAPLELQAFRSQLPAISDEKLALIDELSRIMIQWAEDFANRYPLLAGLGRPIHTYEDHPGSVSMETYSRGEWMTYSEATLHLLVEHYRNLSSNGRNIQEETVSVELSLSGLGTPEQIEQHLTAHTQGRTQL